MAFCVWEREALQFWKGKSIDMQNIQILYDNEMVALLSGRHNIDDDDIRSSKTHTIFSSITFFGIVNKW